jgi:hypothetical protein
MGKFCQISEAEEIGIRLRDAFVATLRVMPLVGNAQVDSAYGRDDGTRQDSILHARPTTLKMDDFRQMGYPFYANCIDVKLNKDLYICNILQHT